MAQEMKAKKLFTTYGKYSNVVTYEYRGRQYDVEYARDWTFLTTAPKIQHEDAQRKIDKQIEMEEKQKNQKPNPPDLDAIWEMLGWD